MRVCSRCSREETQVEFRPSHRWCLPCRREADRVRRTRPGRREAAQAGQLLRRFGITQADYHALFEKQGGVCAICGRSETRRVLGTLRKLSVDHDHKTGRVRGLLCDLCNTALGKFREDPELLRRAIDYIESEEE